MGSKQTGPVLKDKKFFLQCLNLEDERLKEVKALASVGKYGEARKSLAAFIRRTLEPDRFFTIPYEIPENMYKYPSESDEEACRRIKDHVMISVGTPLDFGKESPIDWTANPTYNQYKEWTWQLNRHPELKLLAHRYHETSDPEYAQIAVELFESWVKQAVYPGHVSGYDTECWRTIECGIRMGANWPYALFTFYRADAFTDDVLIDWFKSVWEHADRLEACRTHGNWLIMEMNGLAQIAIFYPWFKQSPQWLSTAFLSLSEELDKQIYEDGFQYELSTGYHDVVVKNYQRTLEAAKAFHVDVPADILEKLDRACEVSVKLMMPNGLLPDINDGKKLDVRELFLEKTRILQEEKSIRWILGGRLPELEPDYKSVVLPWSGFFVMRDGWDEDDSWALFDGAPFGRGHQHEDKLSLLLYAEKKLLLTEGGNYAYDDSKMRSYVLSSRAHNTVLVDGKGQNRRLGYTWKDEDIKKKSDLICHIGDSVDYGESTYEEGYGEDADREVSHNRRVYFIKKPGNGLKPYMIVVDRMSADNPHTYEAIWHVDSTMNDCFPENGTISFEQLDIHVSEGVSTLEVVCGREEPQWQGFLATGSRQGMYKAIPCALTRFKGIKTRLVTVLYPHGKNDLRILKVEASPDYDNSGIMIKLDNGEVIHYDELSMKM